MCANPVYRSEAECREKARGSIYSARMYLGIVAGTVVAARKASGLEGQKLLLVQPVDEHGKNVGDLQVAVDTVQAGVGDRVYLVGSREAALACDPWFVPVDAAIVGIVDGVATP
jgi:ethanolamine utilization protein EutN